MGEQINTNNIDDNLSDSLSRKTSPFVILDNDEYRNIDNQI